MSEFNDIMIDLETLGTVPGCAIVSIGAVAFNEFGVAERGFYMPVNVGGRDWCVPGATAEGLLRDVKTIEWWQGQSEEARKVFTDPQAIPISYALHMLKSFIEEYGNPRVWGNGADFDLPIITVAAKLAGDLPNPWKGYNGRCYRTVKSQFKDIKLVRSGTHHNALDDARSQAQHLVAICQQRGWRLA